MENNEFKNLWKSVEVKQYSENELNAIVVKSAKKTMRKLYPGLNVKVAILVLSAGYFLWKIIFSNDNSKLIAFYTFIVLLILAALIIGYFSKWKMNKYSPNIPVKEWLKFRIDKLNKSIHLQQKYRIHIHVGIFMLSIGIGAVCCYLLFGSLNYLITLGVGASLLMMLITRIFWKDRDGEVRDYLQSMYEQLDE